MTWNLMADQLKAHIVNIESQKEAMISWISIEAIFNFFADKASANSKRVVAGKKKI